jgi:NTE family protein
MYATPRRVALVLAGGAAHGAYEAGVIAHLMEEVGRSLGHEIRLDVVSGTSVGAVNACAVAAFADAPREGSARLVEMWRSLVLGRVLRLDAREALAIGRALIGGAAPRAPRRGGLLDPRPLRHLLAAAVPFARLNENVRRGLLQAVTVTATHIATGRSVVFVHRTLGPPPWDHDPTVRVRAARLGPEHALASAAIPQLFPPVTVEGELYCDGGLRQMVPLSPACRLDADGLIVVSPRHLPDDDEAPEDARGRERAFASPLFLLGKTLDALLLDRVHEDVERLEQINDLLEAGRRRWGDDFLDELNAALAARWRHPVRPRRVVEVRASADIGRLSADYVRSPAFARRARGAVGRVLRRLADADGSRETSLLSYLLFDGEFAAQLVELGRADARRRHEELCAVLAGAPQLASPTLANTTT